MGRRSINTTKSGKFMNPTDQARMCNIIVIIITPKVLTVRREKLVEYTIL